MAVAWLKSWRRGAEETDRYSDGGEYGYDDYDALPDNVTEFPRPELVADSDEVAHRIVTLRPDSLQNSEMICDVVLSGSPVILDLKDVRNEEARRILDFTAGLMAGIGGTTERIVSRVFLLVPAGYDHVEGDAL